MREVALHLRALGHETITYVAGPEASWADDMRWRSLQDVALEHGLQVRQLGPFPPTILGGVQASTELRIRDTTAVATYNDLLAMGLMRGLDEAGVRDRRDHRRR